MTLQEAITGANMTIKALTDDYKTVIKKPSNPKEKIYAKYRGRHCSIAIEKQSEVII